MNADELASECEEQCRVLKERREEKERKEKEEKERREAEERERKRREEEAKAIAEQRREDAKFPAIVIGAALGAGVIGGAMAFAAYTNQSPGFIFLLYALCVGILILPDIIYDGNVIEACRGGGCQLGCIGFIAMVVLAFVIGIVVPGGPGGNDASIIAATITGAGLGGMSGHDIWNRKC